MKDNFVHVCFIIDESGSMFTSVNDVKGGIKSVINEQKQVKDGKCSISLYRFGTEVTKDFIGKDINDVGDIKYVPQGLTAMNDGIGMAIDSIGKWLSDMDESERPYKNMIIIMTDGQENNSKEYTLKQIKEKIKEQTEKYSWEFVYMGADITSTKDADELGIKRRAYFDRKNINETYSAVNELTRGYRLAKSSAEACATMDSFNNTLLEITKKYEKDKGIKMQA